MHTHHRNIATRALAHALVRALSLALVVCLLAPSMALAEYKFAPWKDGNGLLGESDLKWREGYFEETVYIGPDATPFVFDGATEDNYKMTWAIEDPAGSSVTLTFAATTGTIVPNAAGGIGAANSCWFGATGLVCEGPTADAYETTLLVADPTADRTITMTNASGVVLMSTTDPGEADSITGQANGFIFEGATDNAYETSLTVQDPTLDNTQVLPNADGHVVVMDTTTWSTATDFTASNNTNQHTIAVGAGQLGAGNGLRITFAGNLSASNGAMDIKLEVDGTDKANLDIDTGTGDFHGEFVLYCSTAATEEISGYVVAAGDTDAEHDTDTHNFGTTGANVDVEFTSDNAGDTITVYYILVEAF